VRSITTPPLWRIFRFKRVSGVFYCFVFYAASLFLEAREWCWRWSITVGATIIEMDTCLSAAKSLWFFFFNGTPLDEDPMNGVVIQDGFRYQFSDRLRKNNSPSFPKLWCLTSTFSFKKEMDPSNNRGDFRRFAGPALTNQESQFSLIRDRIIQAEGHIKVQRSTRVERNCSKLPMPLREH